MKFFINDFFGKCDQIPRKSLMENFIILCSDRSTHVTTFRLFNWNIDIAVFMLSKKINFAVFLAST